MLKFGWDVRLRCANIWYKFQIIWAAGCERANGRNQVFNFKARYLSRIKSDFKSDSKFGFYALKLTRSYPQKMIFCSIRNMISLQFTEFPNSGQLGEIAVAPNNSAESTPEALSSGAGCVNLSQIAWLLDRKSVV